MNKKQSTPPKKRGATVAAVLCFVAAIAIAGTYTLGNSREARQKEEIARTEENAAKEKSTGDAEERARATDGLVIQDSSDTGGAGEGGTLEKTPGMDILQRWIPEAFLYLLRQEPETPFLLFSFHQEGVICYAKANKKQAEKLEHDILRTYFSAYEPQEEILHDIRFRYYADTGSRFLGCYQHEGVWVASYSKRLLEQVVRKQLLPQEQSDGDELSPFFRQFDRNATANLLFPSDGWQIQVARHDTILWKYNLPWVCTDLFPSEGNICGFCSFPYAVPNDSLYEAMGDSLAIQLEALFPRLHVTPQTSQDSSEVYFTFCSPL